MKNIFVTGCTCRTGVGQHLVKELAGKGDFLITCLVRQTSNIDWIDKIQNTRVIYSNLDDINSLVKYMQMQEVDIVINIAGIRKALNVIEAMKIAGVKKGIFVNTTGVFSKFRMASEEYKIIEPKMLGELQNNGVKFAIIRPTMIYGNGKDHNVRKFALYLNRHSLFPIFGNGSALIQPVYYKDVAKALVALVENEQCWGKAYNISGGTAITYRRFIETIVEALGEKVKFIHLPLQPTVYIVSILNKVLRSFPLKTEQILRTTEDRAFDYADAKNCFGYNPISFEEGIKLEIEELKRDGYLR